MTRFVAILALLFSAALFAQEFRGTIGGYDHRCHRRRCSGSQGDGYRNPDRH